MGVSGATISRYISGDVQLDSDIEIGGQKQPVIIKLEFNEDYTEYTVFQLKIDGVDIDL